MKRPYGRFEAFVKGPLQRDCHAECGTDMKKPDAKAVIAKEYLKEKL